MVVGKKIQTIRRFRGLNQRQLALHLGLGENAQARIGQFESGYRVPSPETLRKIAEILDCNVLALREVSGESAEELMQIFFWLEEEQPGLLQPVHFQRWPEEKAYTSDDTGVYFHINDAWPARAPYGLWFNYGPLHGFLEEWTYRREELKAGIISEEEYFEWKINWPATCDGCGKYTPRKPWRLPDFNSDLTEPFDFDLFD